MGSEYEVEEYVRGDRGTYGWEQVYYGDSRRKARRAAKDARKRGAGAIRTTWRPR